MPSMPIWLSQTPIGSVEGARSGSFTPGFVSPMSSTCRGEDADDLENKKKDIRGKENDESKNMKCN